MSPKEVSSSQNEFMLNNSRDELKRLSRSPALPKQNKNLINFAKKSGSSSRKRFKSRKNGSHKSEILHANSGQLPVINELHSLHSTSSKSRGKDEEERNTSRYNAIDKFLFEDQ